MKPTFCYSQKCLLLSFICISIVASVQGSPSLIKIDASRQNEMRTKFLLKRDTVKANDTATSSAPASSGPLVKGTGSDLMAVTTDGNSALPPVTVGDKYWRTSLNAYMKSQALNIAPMAAFTAISLPIVTQMLSASLKITEAMLSRALGVLGILALPAIIIPSFLEVPKWFPTLSTLWGDILPSALQTINARLANRQNSFFNATISKALEAFKTDLSQYTQLSVQNYNQSTGWLENILVTYPVDAAPFMVPQQGASAEANSFLLISSYIKLVQLHLNMIREQFYQHRYGQNSNAQTLPKARNDMANFHYWAKQYYTYWFGEGPDSPSHKYNVNKYFNDKSALQANKCTMRDGYIYLSISQQGEESEKVLCSKIGRVGTGDGPSDCDAAKYWNQCLDSFPFKPLKEHDDNWRFNFIEVTGLYLDTIANSTVDNFNKTQDAWSCSPNEAKYTFDNPCVKDCPAGSHKKTDNQNVAICLDDKTNLEPQGNSHFFTSTVTNKTLQSQTASVLLSYAAPNLPESYFQKAKIQEQ